MSDVALPGSIEPARKGPNLDGGMNPLTGIIYMGVVAAALLFVAYSIYDDVDATGTRVTSFAPYILLDKGMGWISQKQPAMPRASKASANNLLSMEAFF